MSNKEDNVMDLLDSLDVKQGGQKQKPKKSNAKRKENPKKATGEDILGFLDELETRKPSEPSLTTPRPADNTELDKNDKPEATPLVPQVEPQSDSADTQSQFGNPVSTISGWWSRNKGGLWSMAQETIHNAAQDAVNQARQAEAMVDKSSFTFNALQTRLATVLNTIVPPIDQYEQLKIYVHHDMVAYPSVDELLYQVFDYVMDQVEGGGQPQIVSEKGVHRISAEKQNNPQRSLNYIQGSLLDAANAARESISKLKERNNAGRGKSSLSENSESAEDASRISEVYISIQPVITKTPTLSEAVAEPDALHFVVVLDDSDHNVELSTISQPLPIEWAQWLDNNGHGFKEAAIDPREWVFGWVEDALNLSFGVIAQKYVTTRMGLTHEIKSE